MKSSGKKLYVGCALTQAPDEFKAGVEKLKLALRQQGYEVFDFQGLTKGTAKDVYTWDIGHCVKDCDGFIAICDYPSIGLGYELGEAVRLRKPVLAIAQTKASVTRLVDGAAETEANLEFKRYSDFKDALAIVKTWLAAAL